MNEIIFLGDSITDAFHNMSSVDTNESNPLGNGYVSRIAQRLRADGYKESIRNAGHDGFTAAALLRMLDFDCGRHEPDLVSVLIGCNDVGIWMNTGKTLDDQEFRQNYDRLLFRLTQEMKAKVVCMGPFIFPWPVEYAGWIPAIKEAEGIEEEIACRYGAVFIPLHDRLNKEAAKRGFGAVTTDGIHLTEEGAQLVADAWLENVDVLKND